MNQHQNTSRVKLTTNQSVAVDPAGGMIGVKPASLSSSALVFQLGGAEQGKSGCSCVLQTHTAMETTELLTQPAGTAVTHTHTHTRTHTNPCKHTHTCFIETTSTPGAITALNREREREGRTERSRKRK